MTTTATQVVVPPEPGTGPVVTEDPVAYTVRLDTTVGIIDIIVRPDWAPHGAWRFLDLASVGALDDLAFYRSVKGCLAQFGLPAKGKWPALADDPPTGVPFLPGAVCFAAVGHNSRKSTLFICIGDMSHCFGQNSSETPIGVVSEASLNVLDCIETVYGDTHERGGSGPDTSRINSEGDAYLRRNFPKLTYIRSARLLDWQPPQEVQAAIRADFVCRTRLAGARAKPVAAAAPKPPSWAQRQEQPRPEPVAGRHESGNFFTRHYKEVRELGTGGFGRVSLVRERLTGYQRVCKTVDIAGMQQDMIEMLRKEAELLCSLDHPAIVRVYEYAENLAEEQIIMILEYIPGGGVDDALNESLGASLSEPLSARLIGQLLVALAFCHARGLVHRDVKPENMMLTRKSLFWNPDCKLIDFGTAAHESLDLTESVGTPEYMAPEVVHHKPYDSKVDIWSVAVTTFELLTGECPFGLCDSTPKSKSGKQAPGSAKAVYDRIRRYKSFDELDSQFENHSGWSGCSVEAQDFVRQMLKADPKKRPTAVEALRHPWLKMHRPAPTRLTSEMAESMNSFAKAPTVVVCLMIIVAARLGGSELESLGSTFLSADSDFDGQLSHKELTDALAGVKNWFWEGPAPEVDVTALVGAIDVDNSGGLSYTEFAAACLYGRHSSLEQLEQLAFQAVDDDRDGFINIDDIRAFFQERDAQFLTTLPQDRPFTLEEWCAHIADRSGGHPTLVSAAVLKEFIPTAEPQAKELCVQRTEQAKVKRRMRSACC